MAGKIGTIIAIILSMVLDISFIFLLISEYVKEDNMENTYKKSAQGIIIICIIAPIEAIYGVLKEKPTWIKLHLIFRGCFLGICVFILVTLAVTGSTESIIKFGIAAGNMYIFFDIELRFYKKIKFEKKPKEEAEEIVLAHQRGPKFQNSAWAGSCSTISKAMHTKKREKIVGVEKKLEIQ